MSIVTPDNYWDAREVSVTLDGEEPYDYSYPKGVVCNSDGSIHISLLMTSNFVESVEIGKEVYLKVEIPSRFRSSKFINREGKYLCESYTVGLGCEIEDFVIKYIPVSEG